MPGYESYYLLVLKPRSDALFVVSTSQVPLVAELTYISQIFFVYPEWPYFDHLAATLNNAGLIPRCG